MDSRINPATGDYDRSRIADLSNAIYLRITVPLGSYWADPALGSKLHLLRPQKDVERNKILAIQYTIEALQPIIAAKRADTIKVDAVWNGDGRLQLLVDVYQHGQVVSAFRHYVRVA